MALDRLYSFAMKLELELAIRFLRRRTGILLRGTALAAFFGVALATTALVITMALMTGYIEAISVALQRGNAHMVGFSAVRMGLDEAADTARQISDVAGVSLARPVTYLMGLIEDPEEPSNPIPIVIKAVSEPPEFTALGSWPSSDVLPVVVGRQLAEQLDLQTGDPATVLLPPRSGSIHLPALRLEVAGTFHLAFSEFDQRWLVAPLADVLESLPDTGVAGIEVNLDDPLQVEQARPAIEEVAPALMFTDWREMNRPLFAALRWQTLSLFVVLTLVVVVASFQVSSSMVVLAINKQRSSGMLQALGATPARVRRVLIYAGTLLGSTGVLAGVVFGCLVSAIMSHFQLISFPEGLAKVYMVDHIPLIVLPTHLLAVVGICTLLVLGASLWPAWRASRMDPVVALRPV
jgi:lipoprotein-releasing system permease protein